MLNERKRKEENRRGKREKEMKRKRRKRKERKDYMQRREGKSGYEDGWQVVIERRKKKMINRNLNEIKRGIKEIHRNKKQEGQKLD